MLICAGSFAVAGRHVLEGGAAGNLLSYALQITGTINTQVCASLFIRVVPFKLCIEPEIDLFG